MLDHSANCSIGYVGMPLSARRRTLANVMYSATSNLLYLLSMPQRSHAPLFSKGFLCFFQTGTELPSCCQPRLAIPSLQTCLEAEAVATLNKQNKPNNGPKSSGSIWRQHFQGHCWALPFSWVIATALAARHFCNEGSLSAA